MNDTDKLVETLAKKLKAELNARDISNPALIGIHSGGVWVAEKLRALLGREEPLGKLDISFYRDDFSRLGLNPLVKPSDLPFDLDGRHVVLVDDVLYTGRTIRAGLDVIFDYGRPESVLLAVLVDRGGREMPIQADVVGRSVKLEPGEHIKLSGPEPLTLETKLKP